MKILLDIDGVMIPARPWQRYEIAADGFGMFNKMAVDGLNKIIKKANNPEIVLTTSHKHHFTISEWEAIFDERGILKTTIDRLPSNSLEISRIDEIKTWYLKNQNEDFIILDDDKGLNGFDTNFKNDHLILTNASIGLNTSAVDEAIQKMHDLQELSIIN